MFVCCPPCPLNPWMRRRPSVLRVIRRRVVPCCSFFSDTSCRAANERPWLTAQTTPVVLRQRGRLAPREARTGRMTRAGHIPDGWAKGWRVRMSRTGWQWLRIGSSVYASSNGREHGEASWSAMRTLSNMPASEYSYTVSKSKLVGAGSRACPSAGFACGEGYAACLRMSSCHVYAAGRQRTDYSQVEEHGCSYR